jgi:hypothetical protein
MSVDATQLADRVVDAFRDLLDGDTRAAVGEGNFDALRGMIGEAIGERCETVFERLRRDLKRLESEMVERTPLEL